jgi:hypothetical protein
MSKCYQYAIDDSKVFVRLTSIPSNNGDLFCKRRLLGQKKVGKDDNNGKKLAWILVYIHAN